MHIGGPQPGPIQPSLPSRLQPGAAPRSPGTPRPAADDRTGVAGVKRLQGAERALYDAPMPFDEAEAAGIEVAVPGDLAGVLRRVDPRTLDQGGGAFLQEVWKGAEAAYGAARAPERYRQVLDNTVGQPASAG